MTQLLSQAATRSRLEDLADHPGDLYEAFVLDASVFGAADTDFEQLSDKMIDDRVTDLHELAGMVPEPTRATIVALANEIDGWDRSDDHKRAYFGPSEHAPDFRSISSDTADRLRDQLTEFASTLTA